MSDASLHPRAGRILYGLFIVLVGLAVGMGLFGGEHAFERLLLDLRFRVASELSPARRLSTEVSIIRMDPVSQRTLQVTRDAGWRQFHPKLVDVLREAGAAVIVFDTRFVSEKPEWDAAVAASFRTAGNVIAGEDGLQPTAPAIRDSLAAVGDVRVTPLGGIPHWVSLRAEPGGVSPLSVEVADRFAAATGRSAVPARYRLPPGFWIDFRERPEFFPSFSYVDVLHASGGRMADAARTPLSVFADRVVMIGLDDPTSMSDRFRLPNSGKRLYPGVYGQAFAVDTVIRDRAILRTPRWLDALLLALVAVLLVLVFQVRPWGLRLVLLVALPSGTIIGCFVALAIGGLWLGCAPLVASCAVVLLLGWLRPRLDLLLRLRRTTSDLRLAIGFDPGLIEAFRRESERQEGTVSREVTILAADVRGYTGYVARTDPAVVTRVMAEYLREMERCVVHAGGYINKYIGDEILAVFGFPLEEERSARRAVSAGLAMLACLAGMKERWRRAGIAGLERVGVGIDHGTVTFAEVGGKTKSQFDIIGDAVNGASRMQNLTKEVRGDLLISEEVWRFIETDSTLAGSFQPLGAKEIRGQGERRIWGVSPSAT